MSEGLRNTLFTIGMIIVVGVALYFQWRATRRKGAAYAAFADQRGWTYLHHDRGVGHQFLGEPFNTMGRDGIGRHVFGGEHRGRQVLVFEYISLQGPNIAKGRRHRMDRCTVAALRLATDKPTLQVGPAGWDDKLAGAVGFRDLQLESEEFNKRFRIKSENDRLSYDVLHPRMMEWLLADPRARSVPFRFERGDLVAWQEGQIDLRKVDWLVDFVCDVVERVPGFLWSSDPT